MPARTETGTKPGLWTQPLVFRAVKQDHSCLGDAGKSVTNEEIQSTKGLKSVAEVIQIDSMSAELRNSLWNVLDVSLWSSSSPVPNKTIQREIVVFLLQETNRFEARHSVSDPCPRVHLIGLGEVPPLLGVELRSSCAVVVAQTLLIPSFAQIVPERNAKLR